MLDTILEETVSRKQLETYLAQLTVRASLVKSALQAEHEITVLGDEDFRKIDSLKGKVAAVSAFSSKCLR